MKHDRDPVDVAIGAELRRRRVMCRMSLEKLGAVVDVTYQQIQKYETGTNRIALGTAYRMAEALGCDVADLTASVVTASADAQPERVRPPSIRALKLAELVDRLPAAQREAVGRIVEAIVETPANRADLAVVARDGHPALSYAH